MTDTPHLPKDAGPRLTSLLSMIDLCECEKMVIPVCPGLITGGGSAGASATLVATHPLEKMILIGDVYGRPTPVSTTRMTVSALVRAAGRRICEANSETCENKEDIAGATGAPKVAVKND